MATGESSEGMFQRAREFLDAAGAKTGQLARIARLELDLLGIDRERKGELARLGERGFELLRRGEAAHFEGDSGVAQIAQRIRELDSERIRREREIEEIRASVRGGEGAGTGGRP